MELTLLRTCAGAFGIALQAVVIFRRTPFHQRLQALGFSADMARSQMGLLIRQQATLVGLNDAFFLGTYVFVALAAFIWLAQSTVAPTKRIEGLREAEAEEMMGQG
jgi:DHA2 family multidrug resistance protein